MIAQLMAQRLLIQHPNCAHNAFFKAAVRLCARPSATIEEIARTQAIMTELVVMPRTIEVEIGSLIWQALNVRRNALATQQPQVKYTIAARGRLVA